MARKRGRITVQSQPTKETRAMERLVMIPFLIVSIFFVIIGVTTVIPMAGLFGVVWTLVAICFAVIGIVNVVRKNGMAHRVAYDVEQDMAESIVGMMEDAPEAVDHGYAPVGTTEERLLELKSLYDRDLISYDEYEAKRKDILKDL
jgi:uncharacterized membrane protein YuzA (DUF378 family)